MKKSIKTIAADIKKKAREIESLEKELSEYQENSETGETKQATLQAEVAELDGQLSVDRERLEEVATQVGVRITASSSPGAPPCARRRTRCG